MRKELWTLAAFLVGLTLWTAACKKAEAQYMWPVAKDEVCMVQKFHMEAKMTPVVLEGKTYWICCKGCDDTIHKNTKERFAKDPVSGVEVDKADAVLGKASNRQIHFFENEANLAAFRPTFTPVP